MVRRGFLSTLLPVATLGRTFSMMPSFRYPLCVEYFNKESIGAVVPFKPQSFSCSGFLDNESAATFS